MTNDQLVIGIWSLGFGEYEPLWRGFNTEEQKSYKKGGCRLIRQKTKRIAC